MLFVIGSVLLGAMWLGPLPSLTTSHFSAHMLLHMGVVAVAAPFLALGVAGGRVDPARRWPRLFNPVLASVFELFAVWIWHAPLLHGAARHGTNALVVEQGTFLVAGLWLWMAAFGGDRQADAQRAWTGVAALLFTSVHMTLLGAIFALAPRSVYGHGAGDGALSDQHLGGSLMLLIGGASYLAGGLGLALQGLRHDSRSPRGTA